jgi:periplasmic protein TonB
MRTITGILVAFAFFAQSPTIYDPGNGVTLPQVVKQVQARYTDEAMQNRIEGNVELAAVVLDDGKVGDVSVSQSLDRVHGLDEEAVKAMKQWEFKPGTKDGKPVAVRIHVQMRFALR